tara:strand:+ start:6674 stop:6904 length:231 start_codon:yes stop_codon:yes gene_type:complete
MNNSPQKNKSKNLAQAALLTLTKDFNTALQRIELIEYETIDQDWNSERTIILFEDSSRVIIDGLAQLVTASLEETQ